VPERSDLVEALELTSMKTRDRNFIVFLYNTLDVGMANQGRVLLFLQDPKELVIINAGGTGQFAALQTCKSPEKIFKEE
jgi:hypothetical protein